MFLAICNQASDRSLFGYKNRWDCFLGFFREKELGVYECEREVIMNNDKPVFLHNFSDKSIFALKRELIRRNKMTKIC